MSFDAVTFWIFFAIAWVLWRFLPFRAAKNAALIASLVFYGWWNPLYLILILFSVLVNFFSGSFIHKSQSPGARKLWLALCVILNVGLLGFFKYGRFVAETFSFLSNGRWESGGFFADVVVPVGISFYTFQAMSYSIDIYLRKFEPVRSFRDFFLFVAFFPQLLAGPIVRARELLPQLRGRRKLLPAAVQTGIYYIIWGLFMKVVIADNLALGVKDIFGSGAMLNRPPAAVWLGIIYFAAQVYCDFAGYSAIAIGMAYMMGLRFPRNFNYPYISASLSEFWTRWHITLSRWFRDYVYIPLGGNREGNHRALFNMFLTMLIAGLWHGTTWGFVFWGALHGLGLAVERIISRYGKKKIHNYRTDGRIGLAPAVKKLCKIALVNLFFLTTLVFFISNSYRMAWMAIYKMFVCVFTEPLLGPSVQTQFLVLLIPVILLHAGQLVHEWFGIRQNKYAKAVTAGIMLFFLIIVTREQESAFVYFQF